MTPADLRAARARLGLTQQALAATLSVHQTTVARWETRVHQIPRAVELLIARLLDDHARPHRSKKRRTP